jgi:hypothetical protein
VHLSKAPVAGHVLVLFFEQNKGAAFPYSGQVTWPTLASGSQWSYDGGTTYTAILHHVVQSGETGTYTLNVGGTGSGHEDYMVTEVAGASASNPLNARVAHSEAAHTTSFNFGSSGITPTAAGTFPVAFFSAHSCCNATSWSSISSGWTVRDQNGEYTEEIATGPVQTGTAALNATATLSGQGSSYPGATDVVLLNPASTSATPAPASSPTAVPATPAPAPSSTPTSSSSGSPYTFKGVPIWTACDWYTTPLNVTPSCSSYAVSTVDPNSAAILSNFSSHNGNPSTLSVAGASASVALNTPFNTFTTGQSGVANYTVSSCIYGCYNDPFNDDPAPGSMCSSACTWKIPYSSSFKEQGGCATVGNDCHNVVLNTTSGDEWETYDSNGYAFNGSSYKAEVGAVHNVFRSLNSQLTSGPEAAQVPFIGCSTQGEDITQPSINHVLCTGIPGSDAGPNASGGYVNPARGGNHCSTNCTYTLPMGARLRLNPAKYTCPSASTHPQANKLCVAMEKYGLIVVDHDGANRTTFGPTLNPNSDGTSPWNASDVGVLDGIPITDFDVMTLGTIH